MESVQTLAFVLLSFSEIEDHLSCADLGIEVSGKFFDGRFVIFVGRGETQTRHEKAAEIEPIFAGSFKRVEDLVDFGTAVM